MRITLVVPGLLSLPPDALARDAALSRLATLASPDAESDLDSAILADLGLDASPAPIAALGAGVDVGTCWVARADPVSIVIGRDDARIENVVLDLSDPEREALVALLDAHFTEDGLTFAAPRADAWFALMRAPQSVRSVPPERALRSSLRSSLPSGQDAGRWRRWITETQMLLHEHPLASRRRPVTSLWFSGGGVLPPPGTLPRVGVQAAPGREGDLLRGIARLLGHDAPTPVALRKQLDSKVGNTAILALTVIQRPETLASLATDFLSPALDALGRSQVSAVKLIASGKGGTGSWTARKGSWLTRWTQRRVAFTPPPDPIKA